jgi:integrase
MRRGELCGLQWGDVDLDKATLRVERSLEETKAGLRLKPPKTKRGRRSLTLPPEAVRAHKVQQLEFRLVVGMGKIEIDSFVFPNIEGGAISPHSVSRSWRLCSYPQETAASVIPRATAHSRIDADPRWRGHTDNLPSPGTQQGQCDA